MQLQMDHLKTWIGRGETVEDTVTRGADGGAVGNT